MGGALLLSGCKKQNAMRREEQLVFVDKETNVWGCECAGVGGAEVVHLRHLC